jgi:Dyp-type peroxidase family
MARSEPSPLPSTEDRLAADEIQGNVIPGFLKPHMMLLALDFGDARRARRFLTSIAPDITTLATAMRSRERVRAAEGDRASVKAQAMRGEIPNTADVVSRAVKDVDDAWLNLAISYRGLEKLLPRGRHPELREFTDDAFRLGMAVRSPSLGDPTDQSTPGNPQTWIVGGANGEPDLLLVLAADRENRLNDLFTSVLSRAKRHGLVVTYRETGRKLDAIGTEHFGFQDGISQPGVRGRYGPGADDYVTPRHIDPKHVPESWLYGLPGQYLVWPGEFVFGYPGQGSDPLLPGQVKLPGPDWSRNGSYLAFRRLRQDVAGFREFVAAEAEKLAPHGITAKHLAAYLIGRWPSGAPLPRALVADNSELGIDRLRNNYFEFGADAGPLGLVDGGDTDAQFPAAQADPAGLVCPMFAHIRKVNTRTAPNDAGGRGASFSNRILRRGLPYGTRYSDDPAADRGMLFLSYQTSIVNQFEFLHRRWQGNRVNPQSPGGFDMVVGQNGQPGEARRRDCTLVAAGGVVLTTERAFVVPTGGGYFFAPSVSALRDVLGEH